MALDWTRDRGRPRRRSGGNAARRQLTIWEPRAAACGARAMAVRRGSPSLISSRFRRSARSPSIRPTSALSGPEPARQPAQRRQLRRRPLQIERRRKDLAACRLGRRVEHLAHRNRSPRFTPRRRRRVRRSVQRFNESRRLRHVRRRRSWKQVALSQSGQRCERRCDQSGRSQKLSTQACGIFAASLGPSPAAAPTADSTNPPTVAARGEGSAATDCHRGLPVV